LIEAEEQLRIARNEPLISPSYALSLADIAARAAIATGHYDSALRILDAAECKVGIQPWYLLDAQQTRIRLALTQSRWADAIQQASESIDVARASGLQVFANGFELYRLQALIECGEQVPMKKLPLFEICTDWPLAQIACLHRLVGSALAAKGSRMRSSAYSKRASRLFESVGQFDSVADDGRTAESEPREERISSVTHLDSAVALLELSGHPHILGREAFALVNESGCAEAAALVATGGKETRVIDAAGWTAEQALAAARAAAPEQLMTVGVHRDETWHVLVQPRAGLDERCTLAAIRKLLATAVTLDRYRREEMQRAALWPAEALDGDPESIWASEQAAEILAIARRIAATPLPVLLTGETGTGKEMLARAIHRASDRADRVLVPFNCSAVPRDMLESQLFGYRKGAFTGAEFSFPGVIRATAGGTLFLDEVADIPLELQPKLLRFLEHQEVHPLGESQPTRVDVRIIAATNANLEQLVAQGRFREDLLYRLNVIHLRIPPLRERREEIPTLVQHYIRRYGEEQKKGQLTLSDEALEYLLLYSWPGNIRQLANEVRRMVALAEPNSTLTPPLLSTEIQASRRTIPAAPGAQPAVHLPLDQPLPVAVEFLEQMLVRRALERTHGRVEEAARLLGISRKGLFLKRRRWGLQQAS
jgi:DNA-binding NtrC family response regulator